MIIEVLFRDISWDEAKKCLTPEAIADPLNYGRWDEKRKRPIKIEVPAISNAYLASSTYCCSGPFYRDAEGKSGVCAHIVEIGD